MFHPRWHYNNQYGVEYRICKIKFFLWLVDIYILILESNQRLETIFFTTVWFVRVKLLSMNTPKIFSHFHRVPQIMLHIISQLKIVIIQINLFFWCGNKHDFSFGSIYQHSIFFIPLWKIMHSSLQLLFNTGLRLVNILQGMSSAYKSVRTLLMSKGRSLINIKKSRVPKIDPWGTPHNIFSDSDNVLFTKTFCFLPSR